MVCQLLNSLNREQQKAVTATEGPVVVLAGAGSGKTKTLTYRIAYLIQERQVAPHTILAVTFTNKAAQEMQERVNVLLSKNRQLRGTSPVIGTFHAIGARILRESGYILGYEPNFVIFDTNDQEKAIKAVMQELGLSAGLINPKLALKSIERAKQDIIPPEDFLLTYEDRLPRVLQGTIAELYAGYQDFLKENNALDFGDLLYQTVILFRKYSDILNKYHSRFKYILVDEYQDTNFAQYEFCRLLSEKHQNIFVVGDDYQSIYGFRGAYYKNIIQFSEHFNGTQKFILEQNYRSTEHILGLANVIIEAAKIGAKKVLWTQNALGKKPQIVEVGDEEQEALFVVKNIKNANKSVVLYRTNAQSRALEEVLLQNKVPYRIIGGMRFYDRKEIKDIISYLRILQNPYDLISLDRIINVPVRGIGLKTKGLFFNYIKKHGGNIFEAMQTLEKGSDSFAPRLRGGLLLLKDIFLKLNQVKEQSTLSELIDAVLGFSSYKEYLEGFDDNVEDRLLNIKELKTVAVSYSRKNLQGLERLHCFLEDVALMSDNDSFGTKDDALSLMTIHSAKGLEFDYVFMVGMEQGLLPHTSSLYNEEEREEERRLCYVGVTRGCKELYLTYTRMRRLYGSIIYPEPSEFICEIGEDVAERVIL